MINPFLRKDRVSKMGLLLVGFVSLAIANGSRQGYGAFLPALVKELGSSNAVLAGAFSITHLINGFLAPIVGRAVDRYHPRNIFLTGTFLVAGAFLLLGFVKDLWHIYFIVGLLFAPGISCIGLTAVNTLISRSFTKRRGTALGLVSMGTGLGTFIFLFFSSILITYIGWRQAYWVWGALQLLILFPLVIIVLSGRNDADQREPEIIAAKADHKPLPWRNFNFVLLFIFVILSTMSNFIYLGYAVLFAQSSGITFAQASQALSLIGISGIFGSLILSYLSDLLTHRAKGLILVTIPIVASLCLILLWPANYPMMLLSSILFGLGTGGSYPLIPALVGDIFDSEQIGTVYGSTLMAGGIGAFLGPIIGGWVYDITKIYSASMIVSLLLAVVSVVLALLLLNNNLRERRIRHEFVGEGSYQEPEKHS